MSGGLVPFRLTFTCAGKEVEIYLANQWTANGLYDNLIAYLDMLFV